MLSDRVDRYTVLIAGLALLIIADALLALATGISGVAIGVILWGLKRGCSQRWSPTPRPRR